MIILPVARLCRRAAAEALAGVALFVFVFYMVYVVLLARNSDPVFASVAAIRADPGNLPDALPTVTEAVVIDATTDADWAAAGGLPVVVLDGSAAAVSADGLSITAGNSTVRGLVISNFGHFGIYLATGGGNTIEGNFIGTNAAGTAAAGNAWGIVLDNSASNVIGGTTAAETGATGAPDGDIPFMPRAIVINVTPDADITSSALEGIGFKANMEGVYKALADEKWAREIIAKEFKTTSKAVIDDAYDTLKKIYPRDFTPTELWRGRLTYHRDKGEWVQARWGPPPDDPKCEALYEVLVEFA